MVLLAPACSSFDQFENYEHAGKVFKQTVLARRRAREGIKRRTEHKEQVVWQSA